MTRKVILERICDVCGARFIPDSNNISFDSQRDSCDIHEACLKDVIKQGLNNCLKTDMGLYAELGMYPTDYDIEKHCSVYNHCGYLQLRHMVRLPNGKRLKSFYVSITTYMDDLSNIPSHKLCVQECRFELPWSPTGRSIVSNDIDKLVDFMYNSISDKYKDKCKIHKGGIEQCH